MAKPQFVKATKRQSRLRMAIDGPSGSGKTFTSLMFAFALAGPEGKVAVIDTERGSASKYAGLAPEGTAWEFDVLELDSFHPQHYIEGIKTAEEAGYDVIVIDSMSHAWEGEGGVLDLHDQATKRQGGGNSFTAWKDVTPIHRSLIDAILRSRCHVITTMRSKMEYVQSTDDRGKTTIRKVGMAPIQRQGTEYEFDIVADMDIEHNLIVSKTRCHAIDSVVVNKPDSKWFEPIKAWLSEGQPAPPPPPEIKPAQTPPSQGGESEIAQLKAEVEAMCSKHKKSLDEAVRWACAKYNLEWEDFDGKALRGVLDSMRNTWEKKGSGAAA
jgi:hypothetical protein